MKRLQIAAFVFGFVLMMTGLVVATSHAATYQNAKCVTILNPPTCAAAANSYCNAEAEDGTCDGGGCQTCDATTAIPNKSCLFFEGATCTDNGARVDCDPSSSRWEGECGLGGSCGCQNMQRTGPCAGWVVPCA